MEIPITWNDDVGVVEGHLDDNAKWQRPDLAPGSATWIRREGQVRDICYVCPCGCHEVVTIPVWAEPGNCVWQWDGNLTTPTLTPSIRRLNGCQWHGFITKGAFVTC